MNKENIQQVKKESERDTETGKRGFSSAGLCFPLYEIYSHSLQGGMQSISDIPEVYVCRLNRGSIRPSPGETTGARHAHVNCRERKAHTGSRVPINLHPVASSLFNAHHVTEAG